jgi:hypothetical protein
VVHLRGCYAGLVGGLADVRDIVNHIANAGGGLPQAAGDLASGVALLIDRGRDLQEISSPQWSRSRQEDRGLYLFGCLVRFSAERPAGETLDLLLLWPNVHVARKSSCGVIDLFFGCKQRG